MNKSIQIETDYQTVDVHLIGTVPLLMHNVRLADPRDEIVRAQKMITAKGKKKTDDDMLKLSKLEFIGGLYLSEEGPCIPGVNLETMLIQAARKQRKGKEAESGLLVDSMPTLLYDGPRDPEQMWEDGRFVDYRATRVSTAKVMRTRPIFHDWSLKFELWFLPGVLSYDTVLECLRMSGKMGLGDFRPKYGRFEVVSPTE